MNEFQVLLEKLPKEAQAEVYQLFYESVMHRGGNVLSMMAIDSKMTEVAKIFNHHDHEIMQYT